MVNNVAQLHLVAWLPNRRDTILFESGPTSIQEEADEVRLHIRFDGKEDKRVTLTWQVKPDEDAPRLVVEVLIEDSDRKQFNELGKLISRKNIERRRQLTEWRIANIKDGGRRRVLTLRTKIVLCEAGFAIRRLFWFLGF